MPETLIYKEPIKDNEPFPEEVQKLAEDAVKLIKKIFAFADLKMGEFIVLKQYAREVLCEEQASEGSRDYYGDHMDYETATRFFEEYYGINFKEAWKYFSDPKVSDQEKIDYFMRVRESKEML